MRKHLLLIVAGIILFVQSYGQVTRESYEKAVDALNCWSVYYSLRYISPTKGVYPEFEKSCNCEELQTFQRIKSAIRSTETETLEIANEIENLKNRKSLAFIKADAIKYLKTESFQASQPLKVFKENLEKKSGYSKYTEKLTEQLNEILVVEIPSTNPEKEPQPSPDNNKTIEEEQVAIKENPGILGGASDYLILLAIILSGLGIFLASRKTDDYDKLLPRLLESRRLKELIHSLNNSPTTGMRTSISTASEIRDIQGRIRDLEYQLSKLNNTIETLKETEPNQTATHSPSIPEIRQRETITEVLFLSTPNSDGSFNENSASNIYKEGASIYKFMKTGSSNAQFQIDVKETSIKLALQYPDKNIDPVCEANNAFNPSAIRITTVKMGEAELLNGKWIINSKAVIHYED
jgi:archaellum component FlaC